MNDPAGDVLVELGSSDFLRRYKTYVSHVQEWRQQFQKLESVNLRYDNQVIVNPDMEGKPRPAALSSSAARAAAAAGVKPAALITRMSTHDRALPKPAFELTEKKSDPKSAVAKKPAPRARVRKVSAKGKSVPPKKAVAKAAAPGAKAGSGKTSAAWPKPETKKKSASAYPGGPKPSPAIAKQ